VASSSGLNWRERVFGLWGFVLLFGVILSLGFALGGASASVLPRPFVGAFGPDGTSATAFESVGGLAVDQESHEIYVGDVEADAVYKFSGSHQPVDFSTLGTNKLTGFSFVDGAGESQVAVNPSSDVVYVTNGYGAIAAFKANGEPANFTAGPGTGTNEITGFGELLGVAVDGNGAIYAGDYTTGVHVYAASGEPITTIAGTGQAGNLAVDSTGALYVNYWHSSVEKLLPSSYPVAAATTYSSAGTVDPNEAFSVAVDPSSNELYVDEGTRVAQYSETGALITPYIADSGPGDVAASQGVGVDGGSDEVYVADTGGTDQVKVFGPPPPPVPLIEAESVSRISTVDAVLGAVINPDGLPTTYRFEYGPDQSYGMSVPANPIGIGEGETGIAVQQPITGLQPGTTYHFRVVATNAADVAEGDDRTFTTDVGGGLGALPDGRAYEMVSPPEKNGVNILNNSGTEASFSGDAASFSALGAFADAPSAGVNNWYRAERTSSTWVTRGISPPFAPNGEQLSTGLLALTPDLSRMLMRAHPAPPIAPGEQIHAADIFRRDIPDGPFENLTPEVPDPTSFALSNFAGADPGLNVVAINSPQQLTADAPAPDEQKPRAYVWSNGDLHYIGVLPDGSNADQSSVGYRVCCQENRNAVSSDGSQVAFSAASGGQSQIYLRKNPAAPQSPLDGENKCLVAEDACTVEASAPKQVLPEPSTGAFFQGASQDGKKVFFQTEDELIPGDTDTGPIGNDLYVFEPATNQLRRISLDGNSTDGSGAQFEGVLDFTADGGFVYFAAVGELVPGQPSAAGTHLYVWHDDGSANGTIRYIATLDPALDKLDWSASLLSVKERRVQASADGNYFAFSAATPLSTYDNFNPAACPIQVGSRAEGRCYELYLYNDEAQDLDCVSCDPKGETANGDAALYGMDESGINGIGDGGTGFTSHNVLNDGRMFFETKDSLVAQDSNTATDVYEWVGGKATLISTGVSQEDSHFANATPSGSDVFFLTTDRLVGIDADPNVDLYDARVGGGLAGQNPVISPPCQAEGCRTGPGSSQLPLSPAVSSEFVGPGNTKGRKAHRRRHHRAKHRRKKHSKGHHRHRGHDKYKVSR
jgi:hypothetical protein